MIFEVINLLKKELEEYLALKVRSDSAGNKVKLTQFADQEGAIQIDEGNLGLCLINIEEERTLKNQGAAIKKDGGKLTRTNPEIKLNLFVLFACNYKEYADALKAVSHVIAFFQSKNVFDHQNTSHLHPAVETLKADLYSLDFEQQNHIWGSLGARYLPSVVYRIRLVCIADDRVADLRTPIERIQVQANSGGQP